MKKLETYIIGFIIGVVCIVSAAYLVALLPDKVQQVGQVIMWASSIGLVVRLRDKYKMPFAWVLAAFIMLGVGIIPFFLGSLWVVKMPQGDKQSKISFSWKSVPRRIVMASIVLLLALVLWLPFFNTNSYNRIYSTTVTRAYPAVALMYADKPESIAQARKRFNVDIAKIEGVSPQTSILGKIFNMQYGSHEFKDNVLSTYRDFDQSKHWTNWEEITRLTTERRAKWELWSQKNQELSKHYTITPTYTRLVSEVDQLGREIEELDKRMGTLKGEADQLYDQFITRLDDLGA